MSKRKKFTFLEHMGDAFIEAYGSNLNEAFENAALAMFEVMTDTSKVASLKKDSVEVQGRDEQELLYNWLETLLVKFEIDGTLFSKFKVHRIEKTDEGYTLSSEIWGEEYDPKKHIPKTSIKAVTYHLMEVKEEKGAVTLRFLLDL